MTYHYDLHIHSALSPCADCLMTPNNIFNMAMIKGLDIIAVTDHNTLKQLSVCQEISKSYDILFIPAVEITVQEGFDLLIYFKTLEQALNFDQIIEHYLPKKYNDSQYFGTQEIMDIYDQTIETYPYLLIQPLALSIDRLLSLLDDYETLLVIPHLERQPRIMNQKMKELPFVAIESNNLDYQSTLTILNNSDAHQITALNEKTSDNEIILSELTIDAFFNYFRHD